MSLSDLPDDVLGLISIWLNGFDNCSLWMASDLQLKQRLVSNIITEFHIKYTIPGTYLWPGNFLKKLQRLYRLSLVVDGNIYHLPIENIELFPIETLKSLKIHYKYIYDFFGQNQLNASINSRGPRTTSNDKFINLNDLFCNLEHLEFEYVERFIDQSFSIDFLSCLPRKLKSLSIPSNVVIIEQELPSCDINIAAMLPSTLTELNLSVYKRNGLYWDFTHLPNLTALTTNIGIEKTQYYMIPKNLISLKLSDDVHNIHKLLPFLPSGLRELSFGLDPNSLLGDYLSHLEHLEYLDIIYTSQESNLITKYPPNLKRFRAYFEQLEYLDIPPLLNGITEIDWHMERELNQSILISLPQTLTSLTLFSSSFCDPIEFFAILPKKLRLFKCNLVTTENLSVLPDSLTELNWLPKIPPETLACDRLPSKLETFVVSSSDIESSIFKLIPETLKTLELICKDFVVDDQVIAILPRGLKSLRLTSKFNITDASASKYPPQLQYLSLHHSSDDFGYNRMSDNSIADLPRSLTYLRLENSNFTDDCIKYLPRRLVDISLQNSFKITWRCWKDLPEYLYIIRLAFTPDWTMGSSCEDTTEFLNHFETYSVGTSLDFIRLIRQPNQSSQIDESANNW